MVQSAEIHEASTNKPTGAVHAAHREVYIFSNDQIVLGPNNFLFVILISLGSLYFSSLKIDFLYGIISVSMLE